MSSRKKMLNKLQSVLILLGIVIFIFIIIIAFREGLFSTNAIIIYSIGILYLTIATSIAFMDVLSRNTSLLDEKEMAREIKKDIDGHWTVLRH